MHPNANTLTAICKVSISAQERLHVISLEPVHQRVEALNLHQNSTLSYPLAPRFRLLKT